MSVELLSLRRVTFAAEPAVAPSAPTRADVACFVGFVARRDGPLPLALRRWLVRRGWLAEPEGIAATYARAGADELLDVPVPVDTWATFDALFAWDARRVEGGGTASTYLGAAVRSFFAQGGRRCYVVRVGDPVPLGAAREQRAPLVRWLRGIREGASPAAHDRSSWRGLGHLFGLPDVSLLCLPDLPDLLGADPTPAPPPVEQPPALPVFQECSAAELVEQAPVARPRFEAARLGEPHYVQWAGEVRAIAMLLRESLPEVQLIAALPLPSPEDEPRLPRFLATGVLNRSLDGGGLGSSFVQLAYPWAETLGSGGLPGGIEPPDGILAGLVARAALLQGAHRTAAGSTLRDVRDLAPRLDRATLAVDDGAGRGRTVFPDRVATLGRTQRGLELLSDATPALDEAYRAAAVHRLVSVVIRAVRRIGETLVWEPSGQRLWGEIRHRVEGMLEALWATGALEGASSADAYTVRCGPDTMTGADRDNGRVIVEVRFTAAAPVARITVTLAMDESGQVGVLRPIGETA